MEIQGSQFTRRINIGQSSSAEFSNNYISTTKYTLLNFIPMFFMGQLDHYNNWFFIVLTILQQIPNVSPVGRFSSLLALIFIFAGSAVREIIEDRKRANADKEINSLEIDVHRSNNWVTVKWQDIKVGEFIRIKNGNFFPADVVIVKSTDPSGVCYIETSNLDGETNLKVRKPVNQFLSQDIHDLLSLNGVIQCEEPNDQIQEFSGNLIINNSSTPLNIDNFILRGSHLQNTAWVIGIIIFTGIETKIMRNTKCACAPMKSSHSTTIMNRQVLISVVLFFILVIVNVIMYVIYENRILKECWYINGCQETNENIILQIFTFVILYSFVIPISTQVTLEFVRYVHLLFINNDVEMFHESTETPAIGKTSTLTSDLGMVKYIFTDKTGTLTQNILNFQKCIIGNDVYGKEDCQQLSRTANSNVIKLFFLSICLSNDAITTIDINTRQQVYYASSRDIEVLLSVATACGYVLRSRKNNIVEILAQGRLETFQILATLNFNSKRRRYTVIVKQKDGSIVLYTMGSDDVIFRKLGRNSEFKENVCKKVDDFARTGLRTMCIAYKKILDTNFQVWYRDYKNVLENGDEDEMTKIFDIIESGLTILGATGVEDKLQDNVADTIESLRIAGCHIWMLTGDKQETAINIASSIRLWDSRVKIIILGDITLEDLEKNVRTELELTRNENSEYAMVINGKSLRMLLDSEVTKEFTELAVKSKSVICCRSSPSEKAQLIQLIQKSTNEVTLAIGDGANDVAMIQQAQIGVGISGVEGLQATLAADFAIGQFKFLKRLLLVHGTWNYNRNSKLVIFSYYKNFIFTFFLLHFSRVSGWSGQILFNTISVMLYNIAYTDLPNICLGIFEREYPEDILMEYPQLYRRNNWFGVKAFLVTLLNAFVHSMLLIVIVGKVFGDAVIRSDGLTSGFLIYGDTLYTCVVIVVCLKCVLHQRSVNIISALSLIFSIVAWFATLFVDSTILPWLGFHTDRLGNFSALLTSIPFWICLCSATLLPLLIDFVTVTFWRTFNDPIIQERTRENDPVVET